MRPRQPEIGQMATLVDVLGAGAYVFHSQLILIWLSSRKLAA